MTRPLTKPETYDQVMAMILSVDEVGREMDQRWGCGRLPRLVAPDMAAKFTAQAHKFNRAVWAGYLADVQKHGDAMIRAYRRLDGLAGEAGHKPVPSEQWEFDLDGELVILVRDRAMVNTVVTDGRQANVWSLDEIASVVRSQRVTVEAKAVFPGAVVLDTRPARTAKQQLDDSLEGLPF